MVVAALLGRVVVVVATLMGMCGCGCGYGCDCDGRVVVIGAVNVFS